MSVSITIKNTDKVCVATRVIAIINNEEKRIKAVIKMPPQDGYFFFWCEMLPFLPHTFAPLS